MLENHNTQREREGHGSEAIPTSNLLRFTSDLQAPAGWKVIFGVQIFDGIWM